MSKHLFHVQMSRRRSRSRSRSPEGNVVKVNSFLFYYVYVILVIYALSLFNESVTLLNANNRENFFFLSQILQAYNLILLVD